jgi:hypothetical protein
MRFTSRRAWIALAALAAALAGCGSSGGATATGGSSGAGQQSPGTTEPAPGGATATKCSSSLRVTGTSCATGEAVVEAWEGTASCHPREGRSMAGCTLGGYRCLAVAKSERRAAFCASRGRSIVFIPKSQ